MTLPALDINALMDRYERPLVRYAQSVTGDLESARDVVQESFIKYVRARSGPELPLIPESPEARHIESWLFTVTRNGALDHLRKFSRIIPMPIPDDRHSEAHSPDEDLAGREAADWLLKLLDELTPNQREVIRLKFQNDLSYKEIADVTGLSATNVGFLLHVGLKKLRDLLNEAPKDTIPIQFRAAL
jgi:RNA polymerase sigma-70 factor (ECF subfamily)